MRPGNEQAELNAKDIFADVERMLFPKEVAHRLGISTRTLAKWDKAGKFRAHRTPTGRRYYLLSQLTELQGS